MTSRYERTPLTARLRAAVAASARMGATASGAAKRCLTFRDYMEICLYDPEHGYYRGDSRARARVGREGDFYTSAFVGDAMGDRLGRYLYRLAARRFGSAERVRLVDWGGGTGRLAGQMLGGWKAAAREAFEARFAGTIGEAPDTAAHVTVVDGSPAHRREAAARLAEPIRAGEAEVIDEREAWARDWRDGPVIVVGNELLDAMPVHRVCRRQGRLREWGVAWNEALDQPEACWTEPSDPRLSERMARAGMRLREGQSAEIGLDAADWIASMAGRLGPHALLALVDYGDEARELTAEHRMEGTLMCYRRHVATDDPFEAPGEQDITAHVNFTLMIHAAEASGWHPLWYGTQRRFLVEAGVLEGLTAHDSRDPFHPAARRNRAIRQLLLSDGMSELFKVLILAPR